MGLVGLRFDILHVQAQAGGVYASACVCLRCKGGFAVSRTHRGRVRTLLFMSQLLLAAGLF